MFKFFGWYNNDNKWSAHSIHWTSKKKLISYKKGRLHFRSIHSDCIPVCFNVLKMILLQNVYVHVKTLKSIFWWCWELIFEEKKMLDVLVFLYTMYRFFFIFLLWKINLLFVTRILYNNILQFIYMYYLRTIFIKVTKQKERKVPNRCPLQHANIEKTEICIDGLICSEITWRTYTISTLCTIMKISHYLY